MLPGIFAAAANARSLLFQHHSLHRQSQKQLYHVYCNFLQNGND